LRRLCREGWGARGARPLIIAYTNLDGFRGFGPDDVLIAKWVDANGSGAPDAGDPIEMGRYPTTFESRELADFGTFAVTSHSVDSDPRTEPPGADHREVDARSGPFGLVFYGSEQLAESYYEYGVTACGDEGQPDGLQVVDGLTPAFANNALQPARAQPAGQATGWST
jgi:hypothetical protein